MTAMNDEFARVRGYLVAQAAKLSLPDLVEKVRRDSLPIWDAAASVPATRLSERPATEEWSAIEVLTHVLDMNEKGATAIEGIIAVGVAPETIRDQIRRVGGAAPATVESFRTPWTNRREQLYERVERARGDEHLDVSITHHMFGPLNWREWFLFMRVHDLDHMRQLQGIASALA